MTIAVASLAVIVVFLLVVLVDHGQQINTLRRIMEQQRVALTKASSECFRRDDLAQQLSATIVHGQGNAFERIRALEERVDAADRRSLDDLKREALEINGRMDAADRRSA